PPPNPSDKSDFRMVVRSHEYWIQGGVHGVRYLPTDARPAVGRRALALPARARGLARGRGGGLQVRLVARAPLPEELLPPARARGVPLLGRGADQAHPRRDRDREPHRGGGPPGTRRRSLPGPGPTLR